MTNEQANKLKEIVYRLLEEGDLSEQDVSSFNIQTDYQDFILKVGRPVFYDADKGETAVMPYTSALQLSCTIEKKYLKTIQLHMDQNYLNSQLSDMKDVFSNPEKHKELMLKARAEIEDIMSGLRPEMTKADIVVYFNEQLMKRYSYDRSKSKYASRGACFMYGRCQCSGYTDTMIFLLRKAGFTEDELFTANDNRKGRKHTWNVIKLNNNLYNVDTTWGRHNKVTPVVFSHVYLLQSDDTFIHETRDTPHVIDEHFPEKNLSSLACTKVDISCTDETYKNAFFTKLKRSQEIMHFYNGYWYVAQDNSIYKAKLEDTDMEKVLEENKAVSLKGITADGIATLEVDGAQKTVNLNENNESNKGNESGESNNKGNENNKSAKKIITVTLNDIQYIGVDTITIGGKTLTLSIE